MKKTGTANITVFPNSSQENEPRNPALIGDHSSDVRGFSGRTAQKETSVHRLTLELPPRSYVQLEELSEITGQTKKAEVIRDALKLYYRLANEAADGSTISVRRRDGNVFNVFVD